MSSGPVPRPYRVLLVCMGNICRSPMAEIVLRDRLEARGLADSVTIESAGTGGWHIGNPADPRAQTALSARGYPSGHTARQLQASWLAECDLVVALDRANQQDLRRLASSHQAVRLLGEFDPECESLEVSDPYYGDALDFDAVLDQIERCCEGLADFLTEAVSSGR